MGDPVGIGPEIILKTARDADISKYCRPLVYGDAGHMQRLCRVLGYDLNIKTVKTKDQADASPGTVNVINISDLGPDRIQLANPTPATGRAMVNYITAAIDAALSGKIDAVVTCPINKKAMHGAGIYFDGHTEIFAQRTRTESYAMMFAGKKLKIVLVTIHMPLKEVPAGITIEKVLQTIELTHSAMTTRFGVENPEIAVAGLNPHASESGLFGDEEQRIITPAIDAACRRNIRATGPFPPDTVFYQAANGRFDVVVSLYHDQGLGPFKMIHFEDGVNITIGLPIIRTSVDHGTAYEIAGKGIASTESLEAAVKMAAFQSSIVKQSHPFKA